MPVAFQLEDTLPHMEFLGGDLIIKSGEMAGKTLPLTAISGDKVILNLGVGGIDAKILVGIKPGDESQIDNSNFLAAQIYHRHQLPGTRYQAPSIRSGTSSWTVRASHFTPGVPWCWVQSLPRGQPG